VKKPSNSETDPRRRRAEWLCLNPQLANLPPNALQDLARHVRLVRFDADDRLASRGDEIRYAGVVVTGGLRSSLTSFEGHELSMSILRRGAFYGWMGIIEPTLSPWDVYAHSPTEMACLYISGVRAALQQHPSVMMMVARALNLRLQKAYAHMGNLVLDDLEVRLRRTLFMLAGDRTKFAEGELPTITITQESLGHFVQCSRPTVNKLLRELEDAGLIELGYGVIRIRDLDRLTPERLDGSVYLL